MFNLKILNFENKIKIPLTSFLLLFVINFVNAQNSYTSPEFPPKHRGMHPTLKADGTVLDENGKQLGQIKNGKVCDETGKVIGVIPVMET